MLWRRRCLWRCEARLAYLRRVLDKVVARRLEVEGRCVSGAASELEYFTVRLDEAAVRGELNKNQWCCVFFEYFWFLVVMCGSMLFAVVWSGLVSLSGGE